jgi:hypothetical protein
MLRKIVFVLAVLALPLVGASAASAQDGCYPPGSEACDPPDPVDPGGAVRQSNIERGDPADPGGNAPLARTGLNLAPLVGVAVVLLAGGAVAIVASRRRTTTLA